MTATPITDNPAPPRAPLRHARVGRWTLLLPFAWFLGVAAWLARVPEPPAPPVAVGPRDVRFGLDLAERRRLFAEIARHDTAWWQQARDAFPDAWSRQDDHDNHLGRHVLHLAEQHKLSPSLVFLVYDEGVHEGWPRPDGKTMTASVVRLRPRTR